MLGKSKEKIKNKKWNNKIIEKRWYLKWVLVILSMRSIM
jgi:predicted Zn-dependent protease